jgi:hypothetical protein
VGGWVGHADAKMGGGANAFGRIAGSGADFVAVSSVALAAAGAVVWAGAAVAEYGE